MSDLSPELLSTAAAASFTGLIWVPIVLNRFVEIGVWPTLQNPERHQAPRAEWAYRLTCAHKNAIENLVVFAPLAIIVHVLGRGDSLTAMAAYIYVAGRVAHAVIYALGIPVLRTLAFAGGFGAEAVLALRIFGYL